MIEPKRIDFIDSEGILLYENVVSNDQLFDWFNKMNSHAYFRQCASSEKTTDGKVIEHSRGDVEGLNVETSWILISD